MGVEGLGYPKPSIVEVAKHLGQVRQGVIESLGLPMPSGGFTGARISGFGEGSKRKTKAHVFKQASEFGMAASPRTQLPSRISLQTDVPNSRL